MEKGKCEEHLLERQRLRACLPAVRSVCQQLMTDPIRSENRMTKATAVWRPLIVMAISEKRSEARSRLQASNFRIRNAQTALIPYLAVDDPIYNSSSLVDIAENVSFEGNQ